MPVVLALLLTAAPLKLGTPGLSSANIDRQTVVSWETHFAQQLALKGGFTVTTPEEIAQLLGAERQRQLLGCADASCSVELANALGVDAMILGNVSKVDSGFVLNVKIVSATNGTVLQLFSGRPATSAAALDLLEAWAGEFAQKFGVVAKPAASPPSRAAPIVLAGLGVAAAGAGAVFLGLAGGIDGQIRTPPAGISSADFLALRPRGELFQATGLILAGAGVACGVVSAILFATSSTPSVAVVVTPNGGGFAFSGTF